MSEQPYLFPEMGDRPIIPAYEMWPLEDNCGVCGTDITVPRSSPSPCLPMFEGKVVDPEETSEWAGFNVCLECYEKHTEEEWNHALL